MPIRFSSLQAEETQIRRYFRCADVRNTVYAHVIFNVPDGKEFDVEIANTLEEELTEIIRDSCTDLYQRLKDEYESATSDEEMKQRIKEYWPGCNFRKDGTIFAR